MKCLLALTFLWQVLWHGPSKTGWWTTGEPSNIYSSLNSQWHSPGSPAFPQEKKKLWGRKHRIAAALYSVVFLGEDPSEKRMYLLRNHVLAFLRTTTRALEQWSVFPRWSPNLIFHLMWSKEDRNQSHPQERHCEGRMLSNCSLLSDLLKWCCRAMNGSPSTNSEHEFEEFFRLLGCPAH